MTHPVLGTALGLLRDAATGIGADQLDAATPCSAWSVAQVLHHAAGDQHAWANAVGGAGGPTYNPFDPPQRLDESVDAVVAAAVDAATATWSRIEADTVRTPLPPVPTMTTQLAAAACALDAAVHAWDVAVATGRPAPLTAELAARLRPAADATADALRGFAYAPALPARPGDDAAAALLRYLGRDPEWTP